MPRLDRCRTSIAGALAMSALAGSLASQSQQSGSSRLAIASPQTLLVRFRPGMAARELQSVHDRLGARVVRSFEIVEHLQLVQLPDGLSVEDAIRSYVQRPDVLYAEPDYLVEALIVPNDPRFGELWGLQNTGQAGLFEEPGVTGADVGGPSAWAVTTGAGSDAVIAVIDTGVDYTHEDLAANMFRNEADCNVNGTDDDRNGYVDDCYGIDTINNDADPLDDHNHGTHVAGTIGAVGNNGVGVTGIAWNTRIIACKFLGAGGSGPTSAAVACLDYLKRMKDRGVNIVASNNSWSGGSYSQALYDAIDAHMRRGILFVAAAGNSALNNDISSIYPTNYALPNIISVAATSRYDGLARFSDFGRRSVHLGAPGSQILSTVRGNRYASLSGTSMAAPHVVGAVALVKSRFPSYDWRAIRNVLLAGGDVKPSVQHTITRRRLNTYGALACSNTVIASRVRPVTDSVFGFVGAPVPLAGIHANCANPNGNVTVTVNPGGQTVTLLDDGAADDKAAGDGEYSGRFVPTTSGTFTLAFPGGDAVTVQVAADTYAAQATSYAWRSISGTNLNLSNASSFRLLTPFPIRFAGASLSELFVSDNGLLTFERPASDLFYGRLPDARFTSLIAPMWQGLQPFAGTAQNVFVDVIGSAPNRELVIEWRDLTSANDCGDDQRATVRFQVVFFESRFDLLFNYADATFSGRCSIADRGAWAGIGVQVAQGRGVAHSLWKASVTDGSSILWTLGPPPEAPAMSVTPDAARDFGRIDLGRTEERLYTVTNIASGRLTGTARAVTDQVYLLPCTVVSGAAYTLGSQETQAVVIRAAPTQTGSMMCQLVFESNAGTEYRYASATGVLTPGSRFIAVTKSGSGDGLVTTSPSGIACGASCSTAYDGAGAVTFSAIPEPGSEFAGWGGDADCADGVVTSSAASCSARFVHLPGGAAVQLDGNAAADVVRYHPATGAWALEFNLGSGTPPAVGRWDPAWTLRAANWNADGLTDLFLYSRATGVWVKATHTGANDFAYVTSAWSRDWNVYVSDLDGDGLSDVFLYNAGNGSWFKCLNIGPGEFRYVAGAWSTGLEVHPADVNSDRRTDFFTYDRLTGQWSIATNDGGAGFTSVTGTWDAGWDIYPGDFDGDGRTDFFLNRSAVQWILATYTGSGFSYAGGNFATGGRLRVGDLTGDGRADVFVYDAGSGRYLQAHHQGAGAFVYYSGAWDAGWLMDLVDFNADRRVDVLLYNPLNGVWVQGLTANAGEFSYTSGFWGTGYTIVPSVR